MLRRGRVLQSATIARQCGVGAGLSPCRSNGRMNSLDFAIQMAKDGEAFHRDLARRASEGGFAAIFARFCRLSALHPGRPMIS